MKTTQNNLAKHISSLYEPHLSDAESIEAARNLAGFFETLIEIEMQQKGNDNASNRSSAGLHKA